MMTRELRNCARWCRNWIALPIAWSVWVLGHLLIRLGLRLVGWGTSLIVKADKMRGQG